MGKDYNDNSDESRKIQAVMDGAPAYQSDSYLYVVPDAVKKDDFGEEDSVQTIWETGDKTIEDYYALPEERRVELIDGVFYDMAVPSYLHQNISGMIYYVLMRHVEKNKGSCMPFVSPADVQLFGDDKTMVQPDVFVVCNRNQLTYARLVNAPDLVIEVISPGTRRKDMDLKLRKYREAGVREYWIVFPREKQVWVYLFEKKPYNEWTHQVYTFEDKVPVGIWGGACEVDFAEIDERCGFLYQV